MDTDKAMELFQEGLNALSNNEPLKALSFFEKAYNIKAYPVIKSYLAFSIARERGQVSKAIALCEEAISEERENALHYLNLGRVYLVMGDRTKAVQAFRAGLKRERHPEIIAELERIGVRRLLVIPFLKRKNPLNKYLGIMLTRLGLYR
jgi:tetratricopeptide (TPR) repeat protein